MSENNTVSLSAFFGIKAGMTRVYDENGVHSPVTVIKLIPNYISQVKTKDKDGYQAYQIGYFEKREKLVNAPKKGHLKKAGISKFLNRFEELRVEEASSDALGKAVGYDSFKPQTYIDVTGISKGKGFQGVMKRYNFQGGPASHGSHFHRRPGSIGNRATPGKVFKRKKMPGHMGVEQKTIQNLKVVNLDVQEGYLLVKGSVPGSKNGVVKIALATKKSGSK